MLAKSEEKLELPRCSLCLEPADDFVAGNRGECEVPVPGEVPTGVRDDGWVFPFANL